MYEPSAGQIRQADEDCEAEFGSASTNDDEEVSSIARSINAVSIFNAWRLYETETRGAAHFTSMMRTHEDIQRSISEFVTRVRNGELADPLFVKLLSKCKFDAQGMPTFNTVGSSRMAEECAEEMNQRMMRAFTKKAAATEAKQVKQI